MVSRNLTKRQVDLEIIAEWVAPESRVLDLGCGRGVLLQNLRDEKSIYGVGVDTDPIKINGCIKRSVNAYQGDIEGILNEFPDNNFDVVICSRTVQELTNPANIIFEALRVGRAVAIGFVNHGYWVNRLSMVLKGNRIVNDVYPQQWYESSPENPITVNEFELFCKEHQIAIKRRVYLAGDWDTKLTFLPNLLSGYALYEIAR